MSLEQKILSLITSQILEARNFKASVLLNRAFSDAMFEGLRENPPTHLVVSDQNLM